MEASFRASRLFAFCIGFLSVGEIHANGLKMGFAWPQGLTLDYAWQQGVHIHAPSLELGVATVGIYSEIPVRIGYSLPLGHGIRGSYGIQGTGVAVWPKVASENDDSSSCASLIWNWTEWGLGLGFWLGLDYNRLGLRGGMQRVTYYVPVGRERYAQTYDHAWVGLTWSWHVQ